MSCKAANKPAPLHSVQKLICHKLQVKSFHFFYVEHFSASFFTVLMSQQPQEQLVLWVVRAFSTDAWMGRVDTLWAVTFIQSFVPENDAFGVESVLYLFASFGWKCFWELVWFQEEHFQSGDILELYANLWKTCTFLMTRPNYWLYRMFWSRMKQIRAAHF